MLIKRLDSKQDFLFAAAKKAFLALEIREVSEIVCREPKGFFPKLNWQVKIFRPQELSISSNRFRRQSCLTFRGSQSRQAKSKAGRCRLVYIRYVLNTVTGRSMRNPFMYHKYVCTSSRNITSYYIFQVSGRTGRLGANVQLLVGAVPGGVSEIA